MKKNDIFPLTITDMGTAGEGIGHYEGMTFFVPGAAAGDTILAGATKLKKKYGYARVVEITEPSKYRVTPPCSVAAQCGGCQLQHLSYEKQLELKAAKVRENMIRIGGFSEEKLAEVTEPIIGMETPFRYRNKAQFPVGYDKNGSVITGFYAVRSHRIIPVDDCMLGVPVNEEILAAVKAYMKETGASAYNEETHKGLLRHILIRYGFTSKQIMVCLIVNGNALPEEEQLVKRLSEIPGMTSIVLNTNDKVTNVILGEETRTLWGESTITDSIGNVRFKISAKSFYQVNPVQTEKLYGKALDYAGLSGNETVWDLYCGIGTISLFLAQKAKAVYGVEIVPQAIADAKENAALNHMENAHFTAGKAEEVLPAFYAGDKKVRSELLGAKAAEGTDAYAAGAAEDAMHPDVIVVDPPRKGCDEACLDTMVRMQPKRIVYVSCDPATLARDLKYLSDNGYELQKLCPVDQFPNTMHIENVCLLTRKAAE